MTKKTLTYLAILFFIALILLVFIKMIFPMKYYDEVEKYDNIDHNLVMAIIKAESNFREKIVSPKGAIGLMQVMPTTGRWIAEKNNIEYKDTDLFDYKKNIKIGILYLQYLNERFNGNLINIITGYNAGPSRVESEDWKKFEETTTYLLRVQISRIMYKFLILINHLTSLLNFFG